MLDVVSKPEPSCASNRDKLVEKAARLGFEAIRDPVESDHGLRTVVYARELNEADGRDADLGRALAKLRMESITGNLRME